MKNPLMFIIAVVFVGLAACKKMEVAEVNKAISNEESANMLAGALSSSTNGLNNLATDASHCSLNLYNNGNGCGVTFTDSISRQNAPGSAITFSFKNKIVSKLNCNANKEFTNVSSSSTFSGQYNGPKLSSKGTGSAGTIISGLGASSPTFVINGQFKNMCAFKIKADTTRTGTIAIILTVKDLKVAKATSDTPAMITGGTATASVTGNSPKGAFLFEGNITFNGLNDATLVLGKETYTINLITGAVTKR